MNAIVGYTGFVGSNILKYGDFDKVYNSKNIQEAYGTKPDLLVYAGVPAEVFYANKHPKEDLELIINAEKNITNINPKKLVLISSVNVYPNANQGNEDSFIDIKNLEPYGKNRAILEEWVKENIKDYLIIRLPGLFGENIKKNFVYDLINSIPQKLTEEKFNELASNNKDIQKYYKNNLDGFYICKLLNKKEKKDLNLILNALKFNALNFTDSRGTYQYFNLKYLWKIIQKALDNKIKILNIATEPFSIEELYFKIHNKKFENHLNKPIATYNMKTKYDKMFNGKNGYIYDKNIVMNEIKEFVRSQNENIDI